MVQRIARFVHRKFPVDGMQDDLVQEGLLGLLDAKSKYTSKQDCSFQSYAGIRIKGAMMDYLRQQDHLSRTVRSQVQRIKKAKNKLAHELKAKPTLEQLANELNLSVEELAEIDSNGGELVSLTEDNEFMLDKEENTQDRADIADPLDLQGQSNREQLTQVLQNLSDRERQIIQWRYEDERTFPEIAKELKVSASMCAQLHNKSLTKLGRLMKDSTGGSTV